MMRLEAWIDKAFFRVGLVLEMIGFCGKCGCAGGVGGLQARCLHHLGGCDRAGRTTGASVVDGGDGVEVEAGAVGAGGGA